VIGPVTAAVAALQVADALKILSGHAVKSRAGLRLSTCGQAPSGRSVNRHATLPASVVERGRSCTWTEAAGSHQPVWAQCRSDS